MFLSEPFLVPVLAVLAGLVEMVLAWRALVWLRRRNSGPVLERESHGVRRRAVQALADAALAAGAGLGGASLLSQATGPVAALMLAVLVRALWRWPWPGRVWRDLILMLPLAGLVGLVQTPLAVWAGWCVLVLWRELVPSGGRRLTPFRIMEGFETFLSDEGRATGQLNGRAEGIFWHRRIVLNDALVAALPPDQLAAVVAHEAGHLHLRHREWFTLWRLGLGGLAVWGVPDAVLLVLAYPALALWTKPLETLMIRRWERQADSYAMARAGAANFGQALGRLYGANATAPAPEPLWAAFHHPHPVPSMRLASTKVGVVANGEGRAG